MQEQEAASELALGREARPTSDPRGRRRAHDLSLPLLRRLPCWPSGKTVTRESGMRDIIMSWDLAAWLGARAPASVAEHRALKAGSDLRVRTRESLPMFWPILLPQGEMLTPRSSH